MNNILGTFVYLLIGYVLGAMFTDVISMNMAITVWTSIWTWVWILFWPLVIVGIIVLVVFLLQMVCWFQKLLDS